ncbi:putative N-acetylmannosamine-6-phosphate 2-epimerase [Leifsonia sp. LS1]|uniref:N-acetylmannosamine-6-phosphate 2-epimerase n=1 Tax=Leifsonia sp. LS1 TaxID=2828483 RepID=UPI001CFC4E80|nr:putative N-acetylmannosamine-6-phosphate 2-epimerase [Leifsonia sp. LS1]GIT81191.1 putative N-acetylmannosamine-6-phosphate 2-epimerase [Leifsonia sp. LS1]
MLAHSSDDAGERELTVDRQVTLLAAIQGGLIVSCQASAGSPMRDTPTIARLAVSALQGGAVALRVNGVDDIAAVRALTDVPIIGLDKRMGARRNIITHTDEQVVALASAGADVIAVDATQEVAGDVAARVRSAVAAVPLPIMADVSTLDEGLRSWEAGAAFVGTTLSGYTPYSRAEPSPDVALVEQLAGRGIRVLAEGRFQTPGDVARAFDAGAFAVVVGGAITDPVAITRRFAAATPRSR